MNGNEETPETTTEPLDLGGAAAAVGELLAKYGVSTWALVFDGPKGEHAFNYTASIPWVSFWLDSHAKMEQSKVLTAMHQEERSRHEFRKRLTLGH